METKIDFVKTAGVLRFGRKVPGLHGRIPGTLMCQYSLCGRMDSSLNKCG